MSQTVDRRRLLQYAAASPLVFGLSSTLLAQDKGKTKPTSTQALEAARRHAKATKTPLVGIVIPEPTDKEPASKDLAERKKAFSSKLRRLLTQRPEADLRPEPKRVGPAKGNPLASWTLQFDHVPTRIAVYTQLLLESPHYEVKELFVEATWVCVWRTQVGAEVGERVVLLDDKGKRAAGAMVKLDNERDFTIKVRHLLRGRGRLQKRSRKAMTPQVRAAIQNLGNKDAKTQKTAFALLTHKFTLHRAAIIHANLEFKNPRMQKALRQLVIDAHKAATTKHKGLGGPLPFGATLTQRHVYDPCPPCGMARVPHASRHLLTLLTR